MDELIIRHLQGRSTAREEWELRQWRARDPGNERRYQDVLALWAMTSVAAPAEDDESPDAHALIHRAEVSTPESPSEAPISASGPTPEENGPPRGGSSPSWRRWAAAGTLAASFTAIGIGIGLHSAQDKPATATLLAASEIVTGAGELTTMTLGDGSSIRLGPNSRLRLTADDDRRVAWLEGRAFFGVQADSIRPFLVRTAQGEARALGTRFEVRDEGEFRVLVVDGSVAVSASGGQVRLSEGEMSRSVDGALPSAVRVDDVFAHLNWLGDAIVFQATPLARALREIELRYGVPIRLENDELSDMTVTATFTARPLEEVTFVLCEIVNATCAIDGDTIRIGASDTEPTPHANDGQ